MGRHVAATPVWTARRTRSASSSTGSRAAGVDVVFVPNSFRPLAELRPDLDRLIGEIAPASR